MKMQWRGLYDKENWVLVRVGFGLYCWYTGHKGWRCIPTTAREVFLLTDENAVAWVVSQRESGIGEGGLRAVLLVHRAQGLALYTNNG
ncbi:hypothetical protein [Ferruginibacter profundus]